MCSRCEQEIGHKHPMMKIRSPESFSVLKESKISMSKLRQSLAQSIKIEVDSDSEEAPKLEEKYSDPVVEDEKVEEDPCEYPEMVKRSVMLEYKPFADSYMQKLKSKVLKPEDCVYTVSKDTYSFNIMFEIMNCDTEFNTRWPIYSSVICESPSSAELLHCTTTNKEIRPGVIAKLTAKMRTPREHRNVVYQFSMIDEYGRRFGDKFEVKVKILDVNLMNLDESDSDQDASAFDEKHEADEKYPNAIVQLKDMGVEVTDKIKDILLKVKGRVEEVFEQL